VHRSRKPMSTVPSIPMKVSYPAHAFGRSSAHYWAFLEVILAGLLEYDLRKGGLTLAPAPLPA
jgi:hypothetical protein